MKAYQILTKQDFLSLPFDRLEDAHLLLDQQNITDYVIQELELSPGEYFRSMNIMYLKDTAFRGIVKGVYYSDHPEHIKYK